MPHELSIVQQLPLISSTLTAHATSQISSTNKTESLKQSVQRRKKTGEGGSRNCSTLKTIQLQLKTVINSPNQRNCKQEEPNLTFENRMNENESRP